MLLRASLIVALAAALVGLGLSFKVSDRIKTLTTERDDERQQKEAAVRREKEARRQAREATERMDAALLELETTKTNLMAMTAKASQQEALAQRLAGELEKMTQDFRDADSKLAQWKALGIEPDQIKELQKKLRDTLEERDAFAAEKEILTRSLRQLETRLAWYEGKKFEVKLPNLTGKVLAVDPKYGFVVLNLGRQQGLEERGKMIVTRDGKLVGKVQIASMEPGRSVANIMDDWSQTDIQEGDEVVTSYEALPQ